MNNEETQVDLNERFEAAGREIAELKLRIDAAILQAGQLNHGLAENSREDVLDEVWTALVESGNYEGALVVSRMMNLGSWSK